MTTWTKIAKPTTGTANTTSVGNPIGLLLALTYSTTSSVATGTIWTNITKASGTSWTKITKAT